MSRPDQVQSYHVPWFIDVDDVRDDVTIQIAQGKLAGIAKGRSAQAIDLGEVAMIPGLVNAHTHLEFSLLDEPIAATSRFTDWIRCVVNYRRTCQEGTAAAIRKGTQESLRSGTTLIGDIATTGWKADDYAAAGFRGIVFQELLGLTDERVSTQGQLAAAIGEGQTPAVSGIQVGLSPHAPYSVHPDLFRAAIQAASHSSRPIAMHLAETLAELELLADGIGEFRELLTDFGIWRDGLFGGRRPIEFLHALAECPRSLVIHGNYLDETELRFLAKHPAMTLVYCPRTHAAFGHSQHPWRRLIAMGGSVAIGTDSRASNPNLSLFAELQFLAEHEPDVSHLELLKLGTSCGRMALTGAPRTDSADFCLVGWNRSLSPDPTRNLLAPDNEILGTMIAGQWRYVAPELQSAIHLR